MAAIAHASPAVVHRLAFVGAHSSAVLPPARRPLPTTVYLRRRVVALVVLVVAVVTLALVLRAFLVASGGGPLTASAPRASTATYVVQPGDTFWDIARRLHPGQDPRPTVAELVASHGSPVLVPGERLHLPVVD